MKTIPFTGELTEEQKKNILFWIEELRSGKYEQGDGRLVKNDCYCCLGVACKIQNLEQSYNLFHLNDNNYEEFPPSNWFIEKFGFDGEVTDVTSRIHSDIPSGYSGVLSNLNDIAHFNFNQIADVIEACFINRVEIEINASET